MRSSFLLILAATIFSSPAAADAGMAPNLPPPNPISIGRPHSCNNSYPADAIMLHEQGTTVLAFKVTIEGRVKDISVASSSGTKSLDEAAVSCAANWLYKPATEDGKPIEVANKAQVQWVMPNAIFETMPVPVGSHLCDERPDGTATTHGETILFFTVKADGNVANISTEKSSGSKALDDYGATCAAKWGFIPALQGYIGPVAAEWYARLKW